MIFFAALVSPGSVCRIHRPPTSKLHTIISCKGADALGTVRKQSHSLHVAVCQFDGYTISIYRVKLLHLLVYLSWWKVFCLSALLHDNTPPSFRQIWHAPSYIVHTVVCKIVHKFASVWCKTALGEVGVSLPWWCAALVLLAPGYWSLFLDLKNWL